ncbi:DEAD/DEAH box helicase [Planococcus koreensis]|uniref:DEAD/DEAH box helicase n=1 Tax=Planococcus koreensis TaxID=112331 RepID=UPI0039FD02DF
MEKILKIINLLSRISESDYQDLLGEQAIKILRLTSNKELYVRDLKAITFDLFGERYFIREKKARKIVFNSLKISEIEILANALNVKFKNPLELYEKIGNKSFPKGSEVEQKLFEFFEMVELEELNEENIEKNSGIIIPSYPLFAHQRKAVHDINGFLYNEPNRVLLHMPTGAGKTRTAMNIICDYLRKNENSLVIWLATTEELCQQAFEEFEKAWYFLGNRQLNIYKLWGESSLEDIISTDGIVIAGLPKLNAVISSPKNGVQKFIDFSTKLDFIIMDEAHQAIAPTYKFIIETIFDIQSSKTKKLLGLSATPGRTYNDIEEDAKLSNFFANNKVTLQIPGFENPVEYLISQGYLARVNYESIDYVNEEMKQVYNLEKYADLPSSILKALGEDEKRNIQIILHCETLTKHHKRIIVFAPSVESSNIIATVLKQSGFQAFSLTSNTESYVRKKIIENYKKNDEEVKILVNYGILTTGFDAPQTSAAIIARPTMSLVLYSQMVGRAIRGIKAGGNNEATILTVVDKSLPGFNNIADAFFNWEDVWN